MKFLSLTVFIFIAGYLIAHKNGHVRWTPNLKAVVDAATKPAPRHDPYYGEMETEQLRSILKSSEQSLDETRTMYLRNEAQGPSTCPSAPAIKKQAQDSNLKSMAELETQIRTIRAELALR